MKKMNLLKKSSLAALGLTAIMALSSCSKEEGCTDPNALNYDPNAEENCCCAYAPDTEDSGNIVVTNNITSNTTWTKDNVYQLGGRIAIESGATLTIEPGTIIKGEAGTGTNATVLIVARGGKLMAEGTASEPIIFTSVADEITSGQIQSPNLNPDQNGLWGGLIVLGKAPISIDGDGIETQIEGIPTSDPNGLYGGNNPSDNSGVLKYISIRHGGSEIGAGNEINGLTLGGVGNGTVIENIEVIGNQDDGVEWFGGTVNVKNVVVWNAGDDAIDTDQAWSGTLDNFAIITPLDHCFELDGPEGSGHGSHTIKNGIVIASGDGRTSADLINTDANSEVSLENIFITGIESGQVINRTVDNPLVTYTNITLDILPGTSIEDYIGDASTAPAGITAGSTTSNKANISEFNWTWTFAAGKFSGL